MAITKILNIMESEGRNPTTQLKNALEGLPCTETLHELSE